MIHPSLILSMMGNAAAASTSEERTREMEQAVANMEKAVAAAAVVAVDVETTTTPTTTTTQPPQQQTQQQEEPPKHNFMHWIWILFQLCYGVYMMFNGFYYDCDGIATLPAWSVMWGLVTMLANVVLPLCKNSRHYYHHDEKHRHDSHLLTCFIMLYIWGGSAVFGNTKPQEQECHANLYYPAFWSIVCGMGVTVAIMFMGLVMAKCGCCSSRHGNASRQCPSSRFLVGVGN